MKRFGLLVILVWITACQRKEVDADRVSGSTWHGLYQPAGTNDKLVVTIEFKQTGDLIWQDFINSYTGNWAAAGDKITITFDLNGAQTELTMNKEGQITAFQNLNHTAWKILKLDRTDAGTSDTIANLSGTNWTGTPYKLSFDRGTSKKLSVSPNYAGAGPIGFSSYSYLVSGNVIGSYILLSLNDRCLVHAVVAGKDKIQANFIFLDIGNPAPSEILYSELTREK